MKTVTYQAQVGTTRKVKVAARLEDPGKERIRCGNHRSDHPNPARRIPRQETPIVRLAVPRKVHQLQI